MRHVVVTIPRQWQTQILPRIKENTAYQVHLIARWINYGSGKGETGNSLEIQRTREVEEYTSQQECRVSTVPRTATGSQEIRDREHRYLVHLSV